MKWEDAQEAMFEGARVRRAAWYSAIVFNLDPDDADGEPVFQWDLPPKLLKACNDDGSADPIYRPTAIDRAAIDWVRA